MSEQQESKVINTETVVLEDLYERFESKGETVVIHNGKIIGE